MNIVILYIYRIKFKMSGTNRKNRLISEGPVIILVCPQLGENIGSSARAMANFGLRELRLVAPRDGWPSTSAKASAAKADYILEEAELHDTLESALGDINYAYATTARQREMLKPVNSPEQSAIELRRRHNSGDRTALIFGRERYGLESTEVALADEIITFPVNPAYASLNLSQAVLLMSYEWFKTSNPDLPILEPSSCPAEKQDLFHLFDHLESALDTTDYFRPAHKKATMVENLRTIFQKVKLSKQEIHALRGVISSFEGRRPRTPKEEINYFLFFVCLLTNIFLRYCPV